MFSSRPSRFDLVITDQTMPGMTGVQLAEELLKVRPDVPIILCTGHSETVSPDIAKEAGIREFLMKPVVRQELATAVRRALDTEMEK
jgi:FixJ family two-component response regulator